MALDRGRKDRRCPPEQPLRFFGAHIDTTMAHLQAEVIVPVCSMDGIPRWREKELGPGYTGEVAPITGKVPLSHVLGWHFRLDIELAAGSIPWDTIWIWPLVDPRRDTG